MPLPDDWLGRPGINDVSDLAGDDPARCAARRGELVCNRPAGHDAVGFGQFDTATRSVWWPEGGVRGSSFHVGLVDETWTDG
jgi:hypothetical protein